MRDETPDITGGELFLVTGLSLAAVAFAFGALYLIAILLDAAGVALR